MHWCLCVWACVHVYMSACEGPKLGLLLERSYAFSLCSCIWLVSSLASLLQESLFLPSKAVIIGGPLHPLALLWVLSTQTAVLSFEWKMLYLPNPLINLTLFFLVVQNIHDIKSSHGKCTAQQQQAPSCCSVAIHLQVFYSLS